MSFDDLPDIAIMQVMEKLDLRSRFMMRRVSKKLNGIQAKVKNSLEKIRIKYPRLHHSGVLTLTERGFEPVTFPLRDDTVMEDAICRLAVNTHVNKMEIITWRRPVLEAIANFEVDEMDIQSLSFKYQALFYLHAGRLLKINTSSGDYGWGVLTNYHRTIDPSDAHNVIYILDVLIALDPSSAADVSNLDALKPPQAEGEITWEIVRTPIDSVDDLSAVRLKLPKDMISREAKDQVVRMMKKVLDLFPSLPMLDPFTDIGKLR